MAQKSEKELSIFSILHLLQETSTPEKDEKKKEKEKEKEKEEEKEAEEEDEEYTEAEKEERKSRTHEKRRWEQEEHEKAKEEREQKKRNESLITTLFFASVGFHLWDILFRLQLASIPLFHFDYVGYLVLALFASFAYDEFNFKSLLRNFGIFSAMYIAPVILQFFAFNIGLSLQIASSLILLGLVFSPPMYFSIIRGNHKTQLIGTIYLTVLLLLMIGANFTYFEQMSAQFAPELGIDTPGIPMGMTLQYIAKDIIWDGLWGWIDLAIKSITSIISGQIQYAIDPFQSKVESGVKEKLGVSLDQLKVLSTIREGDEIIASGKLYAKSIDLPVDVLIDCVIIDPSTILEDNRIEANEIYPKPLYKQVYDIEETVECSWKPEETGKKVSVGAHELLMNAKVSDFTTSAYLKGYFMNEETARSLRIKGIEPLESVKVQDRNPIAVHTKGPIAIGMELTSKPIVSISPEETTKFSLEISLKNSWEGKVTRISDIYLIVPKEIKIDSFTDVDFVPVSSCADLPREQKSGCNDQTEVIYHLTSKELGEVQFDEISKAVFYKAKMSIPMSEISSFMGPQQFVQKYFKIIAKYDFDVEKKTSFFVKPTPK